MLETMVDIHIQTSTTLKPNILFFPFSFRGPNSQYQQHFRELLDG